jgi:glutamate decarboxylase
MSRHSERDRGDSELVPTYAARDLAKAMARDRLPEEGMAPRVAYQVIHDELRLDGFSLLNLATFVTTWMEPEARQLIAESLDKNLIDKDEYPQTAEIEQRCVRILADLWHAPSDALGTSTIGSSEACMLGGMAMKRRWQARQRAAGRPVDCPNLVLGANAQICWHKFCRYWEVEPREVTAEGDRFTLCAERAAALVDENTIGVVAILGSTFDGSYEPVAEVAKALDAVQERSGWDVPIHVDAASGGFVAPFLHPSLEWDFRVARVQSINTSGHKYGLVYPGIGWAIFRNPAALPDDLVFHVSYLGGDMIDFSINFSRPGSQVIAQYYNFLRLGRDGYRRIQQASQDVALYLSGEIGKLEPFRLISRGDDLPVFCWTLDAAYQKRASFTLYDLADKLRERGWLVPAYPMPPNRQDLVVQRIVVKEDFSRDLAERLLDDLRRAVSYFESQPGHRGKGSGTHFHH